MQKKYYSEKQIKKIVIRFPKVDFREEIKHLKSKENMSSYIRKLIQLDMKYDLIGTFKEIEEDK